MSDYLRKLFDLENRQVVITGAGGYFGRYIAETFLEAGARAILLSRSTRIHQECEHYNARFGPERACGYVADLYHVEQLDAVYQQITREQDPDVLVNNAFDFSPRTGFNSPEGQLGAATFAQWESAFQSGVYWAVRATQIVGECMRRKGAGSIINIASMYALVSPNQELYQGTTLFNPPSYGAMKAGLMAFTRYVAAFWGPDGIRCNALVPGAIPNTESAAPNAVGQGSEFLERLSRRTLLRRVGHPRDLRGVLLLLASDAGSYITGQGIVVDGGWTVT
jgi:NAD(P)-dependent dehydrogenase (short-subunit alcohol dehydrogenase family)